MKRLAKNFAIYCVPFIVLFLLFYLFEPYDYFGVKGDAIYLSKPLSSMREVMVDQPANIILGDSRMANLNLDYIKEITGEDYTMLGFGGATMYECVELFWFATEHTTLKKVVFGASWYGMRGSENLDRLHALEKQAANPFAFTSYFNYWLEAANALKWKTKNLLGTALHKPEWIEYPEDPTAFVPQDIPHEQGDYYRLDLEAYAMEKIYPGCENAMFSDTLLRQFGEVIDYCEAHDIELVFVFPPMHDSLFEMVTGPLGIDAYRTRVKDYLCARATVIDMEFPNAYNRTDSNFYDGFHLVSEQKKVLAEFIFAGRQGDNVMRYYPVNVDGAARQQEGV